MENFLLKIVTPLGEVFNDQVISVNLPGSEGDFGIYARHANLLSTLKPGIMRITKKDGKIEAVIISWGYVKVSEYKVQVLIDEAVAIEGNQSQIMNSVNASKELLQKALANDVMMASLEGQIETIAKDIL